MSFIITIDTERWTEHQRGVYAGLRAAGAVPVPVMKGNGYGAGNVRLAQQAVQLGSSQVAVGTVFEVPAVLAAVPHVDVLVLEPVLMRDEIAAQAWQVLAGHPQAHRIIQTISSVSAAADLAALASPTAPIRVLLEGLTSMRRFGMTENELANTLTLLAPAIASGAVVLEGLALHLPIATPEAPRIGSIAMLTAADTPTGRPVVTGSARVHEVVAWGLLWPQLLSNLTGLQDAGALWVSHLSDLECGDVHRALPDLPLKLRLGTRLWLGATGAMRAHGTVLAVHPVPGGQTGGYHQRRGPRDGHVVVVSGGTSHGVALVAPRPGTNMRQRAASAGSGALEAAGWLRSPFRMPGGGHALFLEPPHMHVSMLRIPRGSIPPPVGERIACDVRFTTVLPDAVIG